jgi:hypothetical protein
MIPAQPILIGLLAVVVFLYFARLRSRTSDGLLVVVCSCVSALLVIHPTFATRIANLVGIGRGVDLIFYVSIPGLALLVLLLFARTRDLNMKLTAVAREIALAKAHVERESDRPQR